ncbi:MAG TPA: hypothetical protein VMS11_03830 [Solirubrobacterales bacterium]|nr:hypothetical protein [Solirubrobacterales bacterium]
MARETWTDERLDDLNIRVDEGFKEMREELRGQRKEIREEILYARTDLKKDISGVRSEIGEVRRELGALNRTIHQFTFAMVGTVFLGFCGTIAALFSLT